MRLVEFQDTDKLLLVLKNIGGRAASKGQPANLNWSGLNQILKRLGQEQIDYEAFKSAFDSNPAIQNLVRDFNSDGVTLKIAGLSPEQEKPGTDLDKSKDKINKAAASAAPKQLAKSAI